MNISEVKELIEAVSESELTAFDYSEGNINISLRKGYAEPVKQVLQQEVKENQEALNVNLSVEQNVEKNSADSKEDVSGNIVKSPLVGTVYMSPEEEGEPFVQVGDTVKKGQTLAIVEAMKLMNEIESDFDGIVKKVLVENGQTVEYGQELFVIG